MDAAVDGFRARLYGEWLPRFCAGSKQKLPTEGFVDGSIKVSAFDARNFVRAMDSGVVHEVGHGRYRCERSSASEQLFWEGARTTALRRLTLWIEPVITIGTIGRLHLDYGWPAGCLCMQSRTWAFDFAVYPTPHAKAEAIVGEVKKTARELDRMVEYMKQFADQGACDEPAPGPRRNAFRKWRALRDGCLPLFWAVGPDDYTRLYAIDYPDEHRAVFREVDRSALAFRPSEETTA